MRFCCESSMRLPILYCIRICWIRVVDTDCVQMRQLGGWRQLPVLIDIDPDGDSWPGGDRWPYWSILMGGGDSWQYHDLLRSHLINKKSLLATLPWPACCIIVILHILTTEKDSRRRQRWNVVCVLLYRWSLWSQWPSRSVHVNHWSMLLNLLTRSWLWSVVTACLLTRLLTDFHL